MKVLMGTYACEPAQGSEPAVGWHWAFEAVHAGHEVWVVTRSNNRAPIEAVLADMDGTAIPRFEYVDLPRALVWLKGRSGQLGLLAYSYLWQLRLAVTARRLHRRLRFDVVHHVTFCNDTLPSGLAFVDAPFVWGPIGGSTHLLPAAIALDLPAYARRHERVRSAFQFALKRIDPFVAFTRRRATAILVYTREGLAGLPPSARERARAIVHVGVSADEPPPRRPPTANGRGANLAILTGGRLVHWKGHDLLIEGLPRYLRENPSKTACLFITGTGRYQPFLEEIATREGIRDSVEFLGLLPTRNDVFELMNECDLFALLTLRDGPPVALLEAMASGFPVLCLDIGASGELVPEDAGLKVEPRSREHIVAEVANACRWIEENRDRAIALGASAREHALQDRDWRCIRDEIQRTYAEVVSSAPLR